MIKILVDSSSELTKKEAEEKGYLFVPIGVSLGGKEYADGVDLTKDKFYELLTGSGEFPQTSQPSPQAFLELFEQAKQDGDEIVAILLSSALSGTYQSAVLAKQMVDYEGIYLIDSLTATGVIQILADYAKGLSEEGKGAAEVAERTDAFKARVHAIAMVDTLEFLQKGGRIGKTAAMIGELARLKPLITLTEDGRVGVIGKAIGKNKAMSFMMKWLEEHPVDEAFPSYSIFTSGTANCEQFEEKLEKHGIATAGRLQLGAAIGTHIGPNAFGIVYVGKE
ncbi:DegV family protein [Laedolimicola ammoniilytica]|uniref:DegV family protein n=1 Tax=Laedolimicola ammoniilytica TaxID=2981771 RepID=A0ABT2RY33_9FIRM|nr:DegV family protein [Laedolimicola ammoniilytica]MCU6697234.1 DegV family protein [Laedolimicola ammoniilytica]SCI16477.1 DegV domain-containing protein SAV1425 [uncultured Clostridium sp.]